MSTPESLARRLAQNYPALAQRAERAAELVRAEHVFSPRGDFELACVMGSGRNVTYSIHHAEEQPDHVICSCLDHPHAPTGPRSWRWCKHMIAWRMKNQLEQEALNTLFTQPQPEGVTAHV